MIQEEPNSKSKIQRRRSLSNKLTAPENHQQCQFGGKCAGQPVVQGHLCPKAYQRKLGTTNEMRVFTKHRAGGFPPKEGLPMISGIGDAATGYFTCKGHEEMFTPADQVTISKTTPPQDTLDLMALRNIMHRRWWLQHLANAAVGMASQEQEGQWLNLNDLLRHSDSQLLPVQLAIEQSLQNDTVKSPLKHLVFASEGRPVLTAATFGVGLKTDEQQPIGFLGLWGMTVVPGQECNAVCLHFRTQDGLLPLQIALPNFVNENSKVSATEMTRAILSQCDDVVFSKESWEALSDQQKDAVRRTFDREGQLTYVGPDIFSGSEWTLVPPATSSACLN